MSLEKLEKPTFYQEVEEVPWTIQQTFLVILITMIVRVLLSLLFSGGSSSQSLPQLSPLVDAANALITFILTSLVQSVFLVGPLYFASRPFGAIRHHLRTTLAILGFRRFKIGSSLAWVATAFIGVLAINYLYQYAITTFHLKLVTNDQVYFDMSKHAPITVYTVLFISVFMAPICEELFFRSFVFMGLLKGMPVGAAIVFSALIFAVAHGDIGSFLVLFFIGLALAFLRWRTRSIWPGILLHTLNNFVASLTIILPMLGLMSR